MELTLLFLTYLFKSADKEESKTWTEEAVFANSTVLHGRQWLRLGLYFIWIKGGLSHSDSCGLYKFHDPV